MNILEYEIWKYENTKYETDLNTLTYEIMGEQLNGMWKHENMKRFIGSFIFIILILYFYLL